MKKPIPNIRNLSVSELMDILINDKNNDFDYCDNDFITHIRLNTGNFDEYEMGLLHRNLFNYLRQAFYINRRKVSYYYFRETVLNLFEDKEQKTFISDGRLRGQYKDFYSLFYSKSIPDYLYAIGYLRILLRLSDFLSIRLNKREFYGVFVPLSFQGYLRIFSNISENRNLNLLKEYDIETEENRECRFNDVPFISSLVRKWNFKMYRKGCASDMYKDLDDDNIKLSMEDIFVYRENIGYIIEFIRQKVCFFDENGKIKGYCRGIGKELGRFYFFLRDENVISHDISNNIGIPLFFSIFKIKIDERDVSKKVDFFDTKYNKTMRLDPITRVPTEDKELDEKIKKELIGIFTQS